jgi:hypothetical protein
MTAIQRLSGELTAASSDKHFPKPLAPTRAGRTGPGRFVSSFFYLHSNWKIPLKVGWAS